jgi:lipid-A-disaccharide synthase
VSARLLVVAGEASGDRAAAAVVDALRKRLTVEAFGMGGAASQAAGVAILHDLRETTALGFGAVATHAHALVLAHHRLLGAARARRGRPRADAALLVNYSEFNSRLAPRLHAMGVHVLWYGAPQIWAWRKGRAASLRRHIDKMAVMLPFEEALWRSHGVDAQYVGHPACEVTALGRTEARRALGLTDRAQTIAILPGSRPHEVHQLLPLMLDAAELVRRDRASIDSRVLLAPSLDLPTREFARAEAQKRKIGTFDVDASQGAGSVLAAFDVALTASGTAALEAALAGAVPVVAYRVGLVTELVARLLVRTPHYALPNLLLDRGAFPELIQRDARPKLMATAVARSLDRRTELLGACAEVLVVLGGERTPGRRVAEMLAPWLSATRDTEA